MQEPEPSYLDHARRSAGGLLHESYQCALAGYALTRHGNVRQLKGVVHECAYVIRHNLDPIAILDKGFAYLHPNSRDPISDVLFTNGTGVQLKDTVSRSGARETAHRLERYSTVLGTPETVAAVGRHGVTIKPSGVSTAHNEGVASRAGSYSRFSWAVAIHNAKIGAAAGAVIAAGLAIYCGSKEVEAGKAEWSDVLRRAAREALIGGVSGGAAAIVGTLAATAVAPGAAAIAVSLLVGSVVAVAVSKHAPMAWSAAEAAGGALSAKQGPLTETYAD